MKFTLYSELDFEAESSDEALLKLANHFLAQMQHRPLFYFNTGDNIDALKLMVENGPTLNEPCSEGYIDIDFHGDYEMPEGIQ